METSKKTIIVVGAGIVGLTSAYQLAMAGFDVQIVEKNPAPAEGTSKANAGQLLYDRIGATGSPDFLKALPKTLLGRSEGIVINDLAKPANWSWGFAFLRQCRGSAWQNNTDALIRLAHISRDEMESFRKHHEFDFAWRKPGKIALYEAHAGLLAADRTAKHQGKLGGIHKVISKQECFEREPALVGTSRKIAGGVLLPDAQVGDCNLFCQNLAGLLVEKFGVKILYKTSVEKVENKNAKVVGLRTSKEMIAGDFFVIATGVAANKLLSAPFSGKKPIVGVKGISLTFPAGKTQPNMSVADAGKKIVMLSLKDKVRVTGFGIFSDNLVINPAHVKQLTEKACQLMPQAGLYEEEPQVWTGLRPQTPDDFPMVGRAGFENLYVNAGHGSLGWTLAFGSAKILAEKIVADHG